MTRATRNERVALAIVKQLSDFHLDLEQVGRYLARVSPNEIFNRFHIVANQAILTKTILEKEGQEDEYI